MKASKKAYWAEFVIALRKGMNLSQEELASYLRTNQCTVSRWERSITLPNYRMREKLAALRSELLSGGMLAPDTISRVAQGILNASGSSFSMLLHIDGTVLAVTPGSEYIPGSKLIDQCPPEELGEYHEMEAFLERCDFWNTLNACFEYRYRTRGEDLCTVFTSTQIGLVRCCLLENKSCY